MKTARAPIEMTVFEPVSYENKDKHFFFPSLTRGGFFLS